MGKPPPNLAQGSINAVKSKDYPQKAKGGPFIAFLFSIFIYIYISIFYIFNLSPSTTLSFGSSFPTLSS
jgi:hypothetical protein